MSDKQLDCKTSSSSSLPPSLIWQMSDKLLDSKTLNFYMWEADPKEELLPALRTKIDALAATWSREQKDACLSETGNSFKMSGGMLAYLRGPV